jgi:hypothetical protein
VGRRHGRERDHQSYQPPGAGGTHALTVSQECSACMQSVPPNLPADLPFADGERRAESPRREGRRLPPLSELGDLQRREFHEALLVEAASMVHTVTEGLVPRKCMPMRWWPDETSRSSFTEGRWDVVPRPAWLRRPADSTGSARRGLAHGPSGAAPAGPPVEAAPPRLPSDGE